MRPGNVPSRLAPEPHPRLRPQGSPSPGGCVEEESRSCRCQSPTRSQEVGTVPSPPAALPACSRDSQPPFKRGRGLNEEGGVGLRFGPGTACDVVPDPSRAIVRDGRKWRESWTLCHAVLHRPGGRARMTLGHGVSRWRTPVLARGRQVRGQRSMQIHCPVGCGLSWPRTVPPGTCFWAARGQQSLELLCHWG